MIPARSVVRVGAAHLAALAAWFFFCLSQPAFAAPTDVLNRVCISGDVTHGQAAAYMACASEHDNTYTIADLQPSWAVVGDSPSWELTWYVVGSMEGTETIGINGGCCYAWSGLGYEPPGDPDPDPDPEPEPTDIDLAEWARAFGAGFFLVAMFWGLGKGVALILHQVRKG